MADTKAEGTTVVTVRESQPKVEREEVMKTAEVEQKEAEKESMGELKSEHEKLTMAIQKWDQGHVHETYIILKDTEVLRSDSDLVLTMAACLRRRGDLNSAIEVVAQAVEWHQEFQPGTPGHLSLLRRATRLAKVARKVTQEDEKDKDGGAASGLDGMAKKIENWRMTCEEEEYKNKGPDQKAMCFTIQQDGDEKPESSTTVAELIKKTGGVKEIQQEQRAKEQPYRFIAEDGVPNIKSEVYSQKRPCKRGTSPAAEPIPVADYLRASEESIETIGLERQVINSEEKEESLTLKDVFPSAPHKEITSAELFDKDNKIKVKEKAKGKQTLDVTVEADASSEYPGVFCETKIHTSEEKVNRKRRFGHVSEERSPLSLNGEERENKSQADRLTRKLIYTDYIGDDKKKKLQFLALEVCPDSSDELAMKKDNIRVRSSKDSEFSSVPRKDARGIPDYSLQPDASWKQAIVQALKIDGNKTVPDNWKVRQKKKPKKKKRRSGRKKLKDHHKETLLWTVGPIQPRLCLNHGTLDTKTCQ